MIKHFKKAWLILTVVFYSCSNTTDLEDYTGTWLPMEFSAKYEKIVIEKADEGQLRLIAHTDHYQFNYTMATDTENKIKSVESPFGISTVFKYDTEKDLLIDYGLNESYKRSTD